MSQEEKSVPQKGWCVRKESGDRAEDTRVYFDGKQLGGIRSVSIEVGGSLLAATLKLEIVTQGLKLDAECDQLYIEPTVTTVFHSSEPPEKALETLKAEEKQKPEEPVAP